MWLEPQILRLFSPNLSAFRAVTTLSLHSLPLSLFTPTDVRGVFGHFFHTVKKLNLDDPISTPRGLIGFLCCFFATESLTISSPEWVSLCDGPTSPVERLPPFTGKLSLSKFQRDSTPFIRLFSKLPINFWSVTVVDCEWDPLPFSRLLHRVSHSLKRFSASAWFNGTFRCRRSVSSHVSLIPFIKSTDLHPPISPTAINSRKCGFLPECSPQRTCRLGRWTPRCAR